MSDLADDVLSVLNAVAIDKVHFVGLSIGGMIAQQFAVNYPQRILSLVLSNTSSKTMGDPTFLRRRIESVEEAGSLESIVDENMERRYSEHFKRSHPERWKALRETFLGTSIVGYATCMEAILTYDVSAQLSSLAVPTLVICGADDVGTPPALNQEIAKLIPAASYREITGGRHFPNVEFADEYNGILVNWLQANASV
jgi:3-oxoadipate enol-lactonase